MKQRILSAAIVMILTMLMYCLVSCAPTQGKVYDVEITLKNGKTITRQYVLEDSVTFFIKTRKKKTFLVYDKKNKGHYPTMLKKNAVNFKIKKQ